METNGGYFGMNCEICGMKRLNIGLIVHGFALLHAAVAFGCRAFGLTDELMLTLLTMLMTVIICISRQKSVRFMAFSIVLVNILGFIMGRGAAWLLDLTLSSPLAIYPIATFVTTEIIGWSVYGLSFLRSRRTPEKAEGTGSLTWLLIAFVLVLAVRLAILLLTGKGSRQPDSSDITILLDYLFTLAVLVFISEYAMRQQAKAKAAAEEADLARYRYMMLKQQVNPHFLFNSLNILDYLIQEQTREEASDYTGKLADIYRYLIRSEDTTLVKLREEMEFVQKYVDLLQVRWPEGLEVETAIPEELMALQVVPCAVQLLIENATKHNAVMPDRPLKIRISADVDGITVTNVRIPKVGKEPDSTGLGLKYIRKQYEDLAHRGVEIVETADNYSVKLPLI